MGKLDSLPTSSVQVAVTSRMSSSNLGSLPDSLSTSDPQVSICAVKTSLKDVHLNDGARHASLNGQSEKTASNGTATQNADFQGLENRDNKCQAGSLEGKAYKIWDFKRIKRFGCVASDFQSLLLQGKHLLGIQLDEAVLLLAKLPLFPYQVIDGKLAFPYMFDQKCEEHEILVSSGCILEENNEDSKISGTSFVGNAKRSLGLCSCHANTVACLKNQGSESLGLARSDKIRVVLELDGTEVVCDSYLKKMPAGTIFLLLNEDEPWRPRTWFEYDSGTFPSYWKECADGNKIGSDIAMQKNSHLRFAHLSNQRIFRIHYPWLLMSHDDLLCIVWSISWNVAPPLDESYVDIADIKAMAFAKSECCKFALQNAQSQQDYKRTITTHLLELGMGDQGGDNWVTTIEIVSDGFGVIGLTGMQTDARDYEEFNAECDFGLDY